LKATHPASVDGVAGFGNPSIFDRVKPGDEIMATVYDGDYSLHQVKITGRTTENAKSKK